MNQTIRHSTFATVVAVLAVFALVLSACSSGNETAGDTTAAAPAEATATIAAEEPAATEDVAVYSAQPAAASVLSDADVESLLWMREEEKLAHDVYVALYELWDVPVFDNISQAETSHTEAVQALLADYGIADPAAGADLGEFANPEIQALYDHLVAEGSRSLIDALEVGAYIEEMDILDLRASASDVTAIDQVYDNLERGSRNHLRAFTRNLEQRGITYTPVLMDGDEYDAIVSTPTERGTGNGNPRGRADS